MKIDNDRSKIGTVSKTVVDLKWNLLDNIHIPKLNKNYEFRRLNNSMCFMLGYWDIETIPTKLGNETKEVFEPIFRIELLDNKMIKEISVVKDYKDFDIDNIIDYYLYNNIDSLKNIIR